jgi:hypothetical protein
LLLSGESDANDEEIDTNEADDDDDDCIGRRAGDVIDEADKGESSMTRRRRAMRDDVGITAGEAGDADAKTAVNSQKQGEYISLR